MQLTSPVQWEATLGELLACGLERSYELGPNKGLGYWLEPNLRRGCARAADIAGAVGGDAGRTAGARPGAQLRAGPQQGHRRHHEAHSQDTPHYQHFCVSACGLGALAMERFAERAQSGYLCFREHHFGVASPFALPQVISQASL